MKHFLKKIFYFIGLVCIPLFLILLGYLYYDPFKVLHSYSNYSNSFVSLNRDFVSTEMFLKNYKKYNYNSFVFGSSRTLAYRPESWKRYLTEGGTPFLFDASAESIYGIYTKMNFLNSSGVKIDNALIVLCRDVSFQTHESADSYLYAKHPVTTGDSYLYFHYLFFKAFLDGRFLFNFYDYALSGTYKPYMNGYIENRKIIYDTVTNELQIADQEQMLKDDSAAYYKERGYLFYSRSGNSIDSIQRLDSKNVELLKGIKKILEENKVKYRVVISPLYEQIELSGNDKKILSDLFGDNLFDFSGKNQFTEHYTNYYETSHYRKNVGDSILQIIYNIQSK